MKKIFYIDSIDCGTARIVEQESEKSYAFPVALLPKGAKEDQWFSLETCKIESKSVKSEIESMIDFLEHKGN